MLDARTSTLLRRDRLLIIGCGDVGQRVVRMLTDLACESASSQRSSIDTGPQRDRRPRMRIAALATSPERAAQLRALGVTPLRGNLDEPASLGRLAAWPDRVLYLAPPPNEGGGDPRAWALLRVLARGGTTRRLVYVSTSGVYGNCRGEQVDETRTVAPQTPRARRRVAAEALVRAFGRATGCETAILRAPGIYALGRDRGDPRDRLRRGDPVLQAEHDVHTNHVHADDLARACLRALYAQRARSGRAYNVSDSTPGPMGAYLDDLADRSSLPRPRRIEPHELDQYFSPMQQSFLAESRRLDNGRARRELGAWMRYPTVADGLGLPMRPAGIRP